MVRFRSFFLAILLFGLLITPAFRVSGQASSDSTVHICVEPTAPEAAPPSLITLGGSQLLGLVIPQDAKVTVFSGPASNLTLHLYEIATDAQNGGYRATRTVNRDMYGVNNVSPGARCSGRYSTSLTGDLVASDPAFVSRDRAIIIQTGPAVDTAVVDDFVGVLSVSIRPSGSVEEAGFIRDFQIIQISGGYIDLSLPFLDRDTQVVLIANKDLSISESFDGQDWLSLVVANARSSFMKQLARLNPPLDLFKLMEEGFIRIYPHAGLFHNFPAGGYLRLMLSETPAAREPQFREGVSMRPLEGTRANYYMPHMMNEVAGALFAPQNTAKVHRVDPNTGQLFIIDPKPGGTVEMVIQSWLVEVVP